MSKKRAPLVPAEALQYDLRFIGTFTIGVIPLFSHATSLQLATLRPQVHDSETLSTNPPATTDPGPAA